MGNYVERMVRELPGVEPAEKTLDTPEKCREFEARMLEATEERRRNDRRAQARSRERARHRIVF